MRMTVKKTEQTDTPAKTERLFNKEQLLAAKRFQDRRDIVNALLRPDDQYTIASVEKMIDDYMRGRVM